MKLELIAALVVAAAASPANTAYGPYRRAWPLYPEAGIEQRAAPALYRYYPPPNEATRTIPPAQAEGEDEIAKREARNDDDNYNAYQPHPKRAIPVQGTYRWYDPPVKRAKPVSSLVDYERYAREAEDESELAKRDRPRHGNYDGYGKYGEKRAAPISAETSYDNYAAETDSVDTLEKRVSPLYGNYGGYDKYNA